MLALRQPAPPKTCAFALQTRRHCKLYGTNGLAFRMLERTPLLGHSKSIRSRPLRHRFTQISCSFPKRSLLLLFFNKLGLCFSNASNSLALMRCSLLQADRLPNASSFSGPTLPRKGVARRPPGGGGLLGCGRRDTDKMHETQDTTGRIYEERRRVRCNDLLGGRDD